MVYDVSNLCDIGQTILDRFVQPYRHTITCASVFYRDLKNSLRRCNKLLEAYNYAQPEELCKFKDVIVLYNTIVNVIIRVPQDHLNNELWSELRLHSLKQSQKNFLEVSVQALENIEDTMVLSEDRIQQIKSMKLLLTIGLYNHARFSTFIMNLLEDDSGDEYYSDSDEDEDDDDDDDDDGEDPGYHSENPDVE